MADLYVDQSTANGTVGLGYELWGGDECIAQGAHLVTRAVCGVDLSANSVYAELGAAVVGLSDAVVYPPDTLTAHIDNMQAVKEARRPPPHRQLGDATALLDRLDDIEQAFERVEYAYLDNDLSRDNPADKLSRYARRAPDPKATHAPHLRMQNPSTGVERKLPTAEWSPDDALADTPPAHSCPCCGAPTLGGDGDDLRCKVCRETDRPLPDAAEGDATCEACWRDATPETDYCQFHQHLR